MGRSTKSTQAFGQVKALLFLLILDFDQKYLKTFTMMDGDWCSYNKNIHAWCIVPNLLIWPIEIWKREKDKMARLMIGVCSQWCRHLLLVATKGPRCRFTKIKSQMMPHPMPPPHPLLRLQRKMRGGWVKIPFRCRLPPSVSVWLTVSGKMAT